MASSDQFEHFEEVFYSSSATEVMSLHVASHGDYGELGSYEIVARPQADGFMYSDLVDVHNYKNGQLQNRRSQATLDQATGIYELTTAASDIWGTQDDMTYAHRTLVGDGSITVRVDTNTATHAWTKAGLMIRESIARDSQHAFMAVTGNNGFAFQHRTETGGSSGNNSTGTGMSSGLMCG